MDLNKKIEDIKKELENDLQNAKNGSNANNSTLDEIYVKYFSKKHGVITELIKELPKLSSDERKEFGPIINDLQDEYKNRIGHEKILQEKEQYEDPTIDLTMPLPPKESGYLHPTTQVIREMNKFFRYHGFSVFEGPEVETAEFNFRKLNLPEDHPATDLQDTLFVTQPEILLRTHTSSVESRVLTNYRPPIRVVIPGKCFRNETPNKTNSSFFYQYQGVVVDKGITMKHLKATLELVHKFLFGEDTILRFRYKYYPEVSPGMGVDMQCKFCKGVGCDVCKQRGWIEMLGSGMIHYNTLKSCGIDPEVYSGFAFGMGLDRHVMQKFGISDIRKLYGGGLVYKY
ncbi:phenylalanine--tRNA ligase subunit alpha [candidate division WWE3 bacterium]|nr:phenylalanine--tRNA ligase subunit alpha [candidate division WWE3 bacterium]